MRKAPRPSRAIGDLSRPIDNQIRTEFTTLLSNKTSFKERYLASEVFSKFVGPDTDPADVRKRRAIDKWLGVELRNSKTNHRILFGEADFGPFSSERLLRFARKAIFTLLGATDPTDVLLGTFSAGASTSKSKGWSNVARKFAERPDVTESCWSYMKPIVSECETWRTYNGDIGEPNIVTGNVMFTVPKTSIIDRVAAKEPDINMFAQKGIGDFIRSRLKQVGVDLDDQSRNQRLAKIGASQGNLATIDLSSASDSVSTSLVCALLPTDWFHCMNALRCEYTHIDGLGWHENHMFSSMGNGFTFELESMIFWALSRGICYLTRTRGSVSVYGDDIIVPNSIAPLFPHVFSFMGFSINVKKSHWTGNFRESCGKHYYRNTDVSPFYVKEPIANQQRLIHFLNRLRQWADIGSGICDPDYFPFWKKWSKFVDDRFYGGYDVERIDALASPHRPNRLLVKKTRKIVGNSVIQGGSYLHWLRATLDRLDSCSLDTVTSVITIEIQEFTVRRNRPNVFGTAVPVFPQELE